MAFLILLLGVLGVLGETAQANERYAALVVNTANNQVLVNHYGNDLRHPASLTKMMTLYMLFMALDRRELYLDQMLPVSRNAARQPPTKLGVRAGGRLKVEHALLGLVTRSANDAAVVLAEAMGGTEDNFARMMTRQARHLGMSKTTFRNASGLPDRQQITTAWDMYRLARALQVQFPHYYAYFSTKEFQYGKSTYGNHNALLHSYEGTDGIKTGYVRMSGYNLVASVKRGNQHLIGIVFGGKSGRERNAHLMSLFDYGFSRYGIAPQVRQANYGTPGMLSNLDREAPQRTVAAAATRTAPPSRRETVAKPSASQRQTPPPRWYVQVGTFNDPAKAQYQARQAMRRSPALRGAAPRVVKVKARNKTMYQARLTNLAAEEARLGCQRLKQVGMSCVPSVTR